MSSSVFTRHIDPLQAIKGIVVGVFFAGIVWGLIVAAWLCL
jgi:hypothetical protein